MVFFFLGGNKAKIFRQMMQIILRGEFFIGEYLASFIRNNVWLSTK